MGRYTTLPELKRAFPPLEGEPSVRPQRYTTNPIKWKGAASRHRSPYTFPQTPAEEHRLTQRSNNRLHSKIALLKRTYKRPLARGQKNEPVLVTDRSSTGRAFDQYWLLPLTSTGHISDQYWLIFSSLIEYRGCSSSRCSYSPLSSGEFQLCMMRQP